MQQNLLDIIILLGAIQGFITAFLLLFRFHQNRANQFLGWIVFLIALACLNIYFLETLTNASMILLVLGYLLPLIIIMPLGPLVYMYTLSFINPDKAVLGKKHFYPIILDLVPNLVALVYFVGLAMNMLTRAQFAPIDEFIFHYNKYVDIPRWFSVSIYSWLAYLQLRKYPSLSKKWPHLFILSFLIFQVIWLLHLIPYLIPGVSNSLLGLLSWYPVYIPLVVLIYWLGFNGLLQTRNKAPKPMESSINPPSIIQQLETAMERDQLYKNTQLRLDDLVAHTGIPQKTISAVLNQTLHKSFNEFVNEFRVEEVKKRLADPAFDHWTISSIGLESGFNSQATFQRAFKNITQETPKQYKKRIKTSQI